MKRITRRIIQLVFVVFLSILFLRQDYVQAPRPYFSWLGWLDPLTGVAGLIRNKWPLLALLSLAALVLAFWRGRFFCGWLCPVGTVLDLTGALKKLIRWSDLFPNIKYKSLLNVLRWILLGIVLGFVLLGNSLLLAMNPLVLWPRELFRIVGRTFPWSLLVVMLLGLVFFPRFWCRFMCPTGSGLSLIYSLRKGRLQAGGDCVQCGICRKHCPMWNIDENLRFGSDCLDCGECQTSCPKGSVGHATGVRLKVDEGRRDVLVASGVGLGLLAIGSVSKSFAPVPASGAPRWARLLRPPGALDEEAFISTCNRCGQCLSVCPTDVLTPTGLEAGLKGFWTPRFVPRKGRCMLCMACAQVCPTGALSPVPYETIRLGTGIIDHSQCLAWSKGTRCLLCVEVCPTFALSIDAEGRPVVDEKRCIGCGACEAGCPVDGAAIHVYNQGENRR